jgi:hypothetical protein
LVVYLAWQGLKRLLKKTAEEREVLKTIPQRLKPTKFCGT